jgi:general secretion pathway protein H
MRTSAAGSKVPCGLLRLRQRGFTLLELLVVVSIVAIASAGVAFALRDSVQTQTEREAVRLAALLESGRAQSRMRGVPVVWLSTGGGFRFEGLPSGTLPDKWLDANTVVAAGNRLELGPDPIIGAQSVTLANRQQPGATQQVATDGLRPFSVVVADTDATNNDGARP